ncbi:MAG: O-antigen ligase family protein [Dehalococcoidia bacterium]|nr:O-antigen ligase family protein [Dehalococcoidia bacterium]MDW8119503.1 O-antigen ligase family protein [Chloroflexota bacterium]
MSSALSWAMRGGLALLLVMPLVVTFQTIFPYVVGKSLYARGLIEILVALWLVLVIWDRSYLPQRSWVLFAFYGYVLVALIAGALGVNWMRSLWSTYERMTGVWDLMHWFLLVVVASAVLRTPQQWRWLLNINLGVGLVLAVVALGQTVGVRLLPTVLPRCDVDATLGNPSYLGAVMSVMVLVAVGMLAQSFAPTTEDGTAPPPSPSPRRRRAHRPPQGASAQQRWGVLALRLFWGVTAVLCLLTLYQTGTRGGMLGLVAGAVAMPLGVLLLGNRKALKPLAVGGGALILGVMALFALDRSVGLPWALRCREATVGARAAGLAEGVRTGGAMANASLATRVLSAGYVLQAVRERPLLGWGPENYIVPFTRFVEPRFFQYGAEVFDQAHNKVLEELATKGIVGLLSYLALWGALVWAVVRRRRPPREEVLAYAILGALAGYFVQNLFLFDTPGMMLQWAILVGWVVAQERPPADTARPADDTPKPLLSSPLLRGGVAVLVGGALVFSLIFLNYRVFDSARYVVRAVAEPRPIGERLALAERGVETFPPLANLGRALVFEAFLSEWPRLPPEERMRVFTFIVTQGDQALQEDPRDFRILADLVYLLQMTAGAPEQVQQVEPLLQRLRHLGPGRLETHQLLANQELLKGNYEEALKIVDAFVAQAPTTANRFASIRRAAEEGLNNRQAQ